ncbi:MAG: D-2-hydroxyacid dehydrogenase [Treponema sp.]|nr:D-2-hydroxyacid dehydrogenase [Treponema sp.]
MDNALVLFESDPDFREELTGILSGYNVIFNESENTDLIDAQAAADATVIFGNPKASFLKLCPRLKWLQLQSSGANEYINGELKETALLSCATGCYGHAVSEHMAALTLAMMKKLHLYRDEQAACRWKHRGNVKSIRGAVVLVIGLGDLGSGYARHMKALGSYLIGIRRAAGLKPDYLDELLPLENLDEAIPRADVIALAIPATKDTAGIIDRARLGKMKKDAIIINAGRGSAIDTEALCDALEAGALGGAGLEVTDPEPLPPEHRLWKLENAFITPHVAGGRYMPETYQYIMRLNLENARRFIQGQDLKSLVDTKTGYCFPKKAE